MCSPLRKLKGSQCEVTYERIDGVVYVFKARLYPNGNQTRFVSKRVVRDLFVVFFYVRFVPDSIKIENTRCMSFDIKFTRLCFENACTIARASLGMSTTLLEALPGKLDIKRHASSILYFSFWVLVLVSNYGISWKFLLLW